MRIFLRPITEKDTFNIVKWRNSDKVRSHCMTKMPITEESNLQFYKDNILTGKYKQYIVERIEEETGLATYPIATVYLKDLDYENQRCELCIFTSDDVEWDAVGQSIAINLLVDKAFNEFGMHKVYSYVFAQNKDEILLLQKAGLTIESRMKEEAKDLEGEFVDVIRLAIINK